jgi:serine/threonine protein kinase
MTTLKHQKRRSIYTNAEHSKLKLRYASSITGFHLRKAGTGQWGGTLALLVFARELGTVASQVRKTVDREVRVLKALCHAHVVSLLDAFQVSGRMHLVFEYVERTVLDSLKLQPDGLGDAATRRILWQLIKAVEHLHTQKVLSAERPPSACAAGRDPPPRPLSRRSAQCLSQC